MSKLPSPIKPFMPESQNGNGKTMVIDGEIVEIITELDNVLIVKKGGKTATWSKKKRCLAIPWRDQAAPHYPARTL